MPASRWTLAKQGLEDARELGGGAHHVEPESWDFRFDGPVWVLSLDDEQTHALAGIIAGGGGSLGLLLGPFWPPAAAAMGAAISYILAVNELGGSNGVDIHGVLGKQGVWVTPRLSGMFDLLKQGVTAAAAVVTTAEFVLAASSQVPALAAALQIPVVASVFGAVSSGTPLGWALAGALGLGVHLLDQEPDLNSHGGVHADRDQALEWERFTMTSLGPPDQIALLSWQGFFSAQGGGGADVYANRPHVLDWERWYLVPNGDGTVSLKTFNGHYLVAEGGGGRECWANRTAIGPWEKFVLVPQPDGRVALRTWLSNKFVSVQPGV